MKTFLRQSFLKALGLISLFKKGEGVPIFTYHSIDNSNSFISISPQVFRKQMEYLAGNGYKTLTLSQLEGQQSQKEKICVLTFDDGFKSVYEHAFRVLKEFSFTATIFLTTGYINSTFVNFPMLNWDEIEEMNAYGIEFGAHTVTHPFLTRLPQNEILKEVLDSKRILEKRLGEKVNFFCYPYGDYNETTKRIVKAAGFKGACTIEFGRWKPGDDCFAIKRLGLNRISPYDHAAQILFFKRCLDGTAEIYHKLKLCLK